MSRMIKPIIITFYSFRGGVGRSMAMLNAGYLLARSGRRVLLVDFDLEAPGLTRLIDRQDILKPKAKPSTPKGMVDIIHGYLFAKEKSILRAKNPYRSLNSYLSQLDIPKPKVSSAKPGTLHLMPAGRKRNYEKQLGELYMSSRQFKDIRKSFATRFRQFLLDSGRFDYIFIDARTGFSDEGYIAAKFLCDHLIVLSGLNDQNIKGTADFLTKVAAWKDEDAGPQKVVLVASPVCEYEDDKKKKRYKEARETLKKVTGADIGFSLSLPYHPRLSLYEELVAIKWPDSGLGRAYRDLEHIIRDINHDARDHWAKRTRDALEHRKIEDFDAAITELAAIDLEQAVNIARQTSISFEDSVGERAREILPVFDLLEKIDMEPLYALQAARVARNARLSNGQILKYLDRAEAIARQQDYHPLLSVILIERASCVADSDTARARQLIQKALVLSKAHDTQDLRVRRLLQASNADELLPDYTAAITHAQHALHIARNLDQKDFILSTLKQLAWLHTRQTNYADARQAAEELLKLSSTHLDNSVYVLNALESLADLDIHQGHYSAAHRRLNDLLKISREQNSSLYIAAALNGLAELNCEEGSFAKARSQSREALTIFSELNFRDGISAMHDMISSLDLAQGDYTAAKRGAKRSLRIFYRLHNRQGISCAIHRLAVLDRLQGNSSSARKHYEESLKIDRKLGDRRGIATTLWGLGEQHRLTGNYTGALKAFNESLRILRQTRLADNPLLEANAEAARLQSNTARSLTKLRSLVNRADQAHDVNDRAESHLLLGTIERERGLFKKALQSLKKASVTAEKFQIRDTLAFAQAQRALCFASLAQPDDAAKAANAALKFFKAQNVRHPNAAELKKLAKPPAKSKRKKKSKKP
ncbi:MAG: tetratricopeptide repeat protein [Planctomycetes bacterium]|nr:tetratricopeptide repeat protein [Planctomycetota bacterium]